MSKWLIVDDHEEEVQAFIGAFQRCGISIEYLRPREARERLLIHAQEQISGVLMDVDLSAEAQHLGSGPGIAQDIRLNQKSASSTGGRTSEFPVVRFSSWDKVQRMIGGDPGSDDLFDLSIDKQLFESHQERYCRELRGIETIYRTLPTLDADSEALFGLTVAQHHWSHTALRDRVAASLAAAVHVAAGVVLRDFLQPVGLLIDEHVLSYRLGVEPGASGAAWRRLLSTLEPFKYRGVGHEDFDRWWARGVEEWWVAQTNEVRSLASLTIEQRLARLVPSFEGLQALRMPATSPGGAPWVPCYLHLHRMKPVMVPVDPRYGIRVTTTVDVPVWTDPRLACLDCAVQNRMSDRRIDRDDITRVSAAVRSGRQ